MKTKVSLAFVALLLGSAIGFILSQGNKENEDDKITNVRSVSRKNQTISTAASVRGRKIKGIEESLKIAKQGNRINALVNYFEQLDSAGFKQEADKLKNLSKGDRMMVGYLLFSQWGEVDPNAAMAYTKTLYNMGPFMKNAVLKSWALNSPEDAAAYYNSKSDRSLSGGRAPDGKASGVITAEWLEKDPDAAIAWIQTLDDYSRNSVVRDTFIKLLQSDPDDAVARLTSIESPKTKALARDALAYNWSQEDWEATQAWISSLPSDEQSAARAKAIQGLSKVNYQSAVAELSNFPETAENNVLLSNIATDWAVKDAAGATEWVLTMGSEQDKVYNLYYPMSQWASNDPSGALEFVNNLADGAIRDRAINVFVDKNSGADTDLNLRLAESISDPKVRSQSVLSALGKWVKEDKDAATDYINSADWLSARDKRQIRWISRTR